MTRNVRWTVGSLLVVLVLSGCGGFDDGACVRVDATRRTFCRNAQLRLSCEGEGQTFTTDSSCQDLGYLHSCDKDAWYNERVYCTLTGS
jgi:hypothetical protein